MLFLFILLHELSRKNFSKKLRKNILLFLRSVVEYTRKQQEQVRLPNITHHFPPYHKVASRSVMLRGVIFIKRLIVKKEGTTMSLQKVKDYFRSLGMEDRVIEFSVSSATVPLAAQAIGCAQTQIAKTLSFYLDETPILIVMAGTAKADNAKYKAAFHKKAKMIPFEEVEAATGHAAGGVCPFCVKEGVKIYLDESLKTNEGTNGGVVYPAAGSSNSAVRLTVAELEQCAPHEGWIDVCRLPE